MKTSIIAFTEKGCKIGLTLEKELNGDFSYGTGENKVDSNKWIADAWDKSDLIIFVAAAGIAVRKITKHVTSKAKDPAVLVIDDNGKFCISLLSGHIGKANKYAEYVSQIIDAVPVITTSTDINKVFSIDSWATEWNMTIVNPEKIKEVSKCALEGEIIDPYKDAEIGIYKKDTEKLILVPKVLSVGIGCKKGTEPQKLKDFYSKIFKELNIYECAVSSIATIDIKKDEDAINRLCEDKAVSLQIFTSEELNKLDGDFTSSDLVKKTVGTDNVCERSAVLVNQGKLILKKTSLDGMTIAISIKE
ncbi:MAG TPA: cobalamin biosynthesis protein [Anaerovoracaceae bacterium]|nr:cobalamin biosynthesis protein [Anaerovoracaceae bacterium]